MSKYLENVFVKTMYMLTSPADRTFGADGIWIVAQKNARPVIGTRAGFAIVRGSFQWITVVSPTT